MPISDVLHAVRRVIASEASKLVVLFDFQWIEHSMCAVLILVSEGFRNHPLFR